MGRGRVAPPIKDGDWTSVRQAINRLSAVIFGSEASPTLAGLTLGNTGLHLLDIDASHDLIIKPGSNLSADKTLTLTTGDSDREITLSGSPTLADWFNQDVKQAASPTFAGLTLTNDLTVAHGGTGQSTAQGAIDILSAVSGATNEHVLTKDTASGNAIWKVAAGGGALDLTPIAGDIIRVIDAAVSPFDGLINGVPTATSVVYDNDTNENMFNGLGAYNGTTFWGKIILHNTTRGNSRKIESVNIATNTITTESSTDDWANDDVITVQSQTNTFAGYFDIDLSDHITSGVDNILLNALIWNRSGAGATFGGLILHPFEARNVGKESSTYAAIDDEVSTTQFFVPVIDQKITMWFRALTDHYVSILAQGTVGS